MNVENIEDFSDLTDFIQNEYIKISDNLGIKQASESMINFTEKALKKYFNLYNKPLYRMAKRELKLKEAIDTMPHSKIWKFLHSKLQAQIDARLAIIDEEQRVNSKNEQSQVIETLPAVIIKQQGLPQVSDF